MLSFFFTRRIITLLNFIFSNPTFLINYCILLLFILFYVIFKLCMIFCFLVGFCIEFHGHQKTPTRGDGATLPLRLIADSV